MRFPSRRESGFGLLEALTGLIVFVVLVMMGSRAYRNVVANHKAADQVKAVTDAVSATAEGLSGLTLDALAGPGSPYLDWSEPAMAGAGPYHYRYRTVPRPSVGGVQDTAVVGLEVEAGLMQGGAFVASRRFATLIPPNLASRSNTGAQYSTKAERDAEAAFHSGLMARIDDLTVRVVPENEERLNSFSCYDPGQCCGFMRKYFADLALHPQDGLDEKCNYRCAQGGDVSIESWNRACGMDFCTVSPWKNKADCCRAIADGTCKSGSVCARICIDCFGVDGSTCGPPPCEPYYFPDFFDCERGTYCNGQPLPDGEIPGWGNVKAWCKQPECRSIKATCSETVADCCENYWRLIKTGQPVSAPFEVCAQLTRPEDCCSWEPIMGYWTLNCGTDGRLISAKVNADGQWYCTFPTPAWSDNCAMMKGCGSTVTPAGAPNGGCQPWTGPAYESPWIDPITGIAAGTTTVGGGGGGGGGGTITTDGGGKDRKGSKRDGNKWQGRGGRE